MKKVFFLIAVVFVATFVLCACERKNAYVLSASKRGDMDTLKKYIGEDKDIVKITDSAGKTPLHLAAENGFWTAIEFFAENGADINAKDHNSRTPLHLAAENGYINASIVLLMKGANINTRDVNGKTPLFASVENRNKNETALLLIAGADTEILDNEGSTVFHFVAEKDYAGIADELISFGANTGIKNKNGIGPMTIATQYAAASTAEIIGKSGDSWILDTDIAAVSGNVDKLRELAEKYEKITEKKVISGKYANSKLIDFAARGGNPAVFDYLLSSGADINAKDIYGYTPLLSIMNVDNADFGMMKYLLSKGADIDFIGPNLNPLMYAATENYREGAEFLMARGAFIEAEDPNQRPPLLLAFSNFSTETSEFLLEAGANAPVDAGSISTYFPKDKSRRKMLEDVRAFLAERKIKKKFLKELELYDTNAWLDDIHIAVMSGDIPQARRILSHDPALVDEKAADGNYIENTAKEMTTLNSMKKFKLMFAEKQTPLFYAILSGYEDVTETLLAFGADFDHTDNVPPDGIWLADIHLAALNGDVARARRILSKDQSLADEESLGGKCNAGKDDPIYQYPVSVVEKICAQGKTPLHYAILSGSADIAEMLLAAGADVNHTDINDSTPLMFAAAAGDVKSVTLLLASGARTDIADKFDRDAADVAAPGVKSLLGG